MALHDGDSATGSPPSLGLHVANPLRRRNVAARLHLIGSVGSHGDGQDFKRAGLSHHGSHNSHRWVRLGGNGLLGTTAETPLIGPILPASVRREACHPSE